MKRPIPPRLHVILARDAPNAVVVRRGPARYTATIGWDRRNDQFTMGQWLWGRIYERRADLSPDGTHLVYFAMNGRWSGEAKGAWTAVSRAPYLKAVSLYPKGDCWHGGGLFHSNREFWLNGGHGHPPLQQDKHLRFTQAFPWHEHYGGECASVYFIRLQRDGWAMKHSSRDAQGRDVTLFEKPVDARWLLRKRAWASLEKTPGRAVYYDTHALFNTRTGEELAKDDWEWADVDGKRIAWAAGGALHAGRLDAKGLADEKLLFDFSGMKPEKIAAPY